MTKFKRFLSSTLILTMVGVSGLLSTTAKADSSGYDVPDFSIIIGTKIVTGGVDNGTDIRLRGLFDNTTFPQNGVYTFSAYAGASSLDARLDYYVDGVKIDGALDDLNTTVDTSVIGSHVIRIVATMTATGEVENKYIYYSVIKNPEDSSVDVSQ